tara:strand:- start:250 stop:516 length:267 start_codon:yes stop_codon:yes gene_type:complete
MEIVSFKLHKQILKKMDKVLRPFNYNNRTEFIREAIREKLDRVDYEQAMKNLKKNFGASPIKISDEELEETRRRVGLEYAKKCGIKLD